MTTAVTQSPPIDGAAIRAVEELVRTPSVSGNESAAAQVFVTLATDLGMQSWIDRVGNAIAMRGDSSADAREIILLGHIDTVPGDIPVRIEDGVLWGRGSVDAKGPLAAFLIAASRATIPDGVRIVVAGAVGEETARSPGARHLAATRRPHACIIGEPSGFDGVTLGYKGRLLVHATLTRSCAHTAGPDGSAADALLAWYSDLNCGLQSAGTPNPQSAPTPPRAFDSLQQTVRSLATTTDGLADTASMTIGLRLPPGVDPHSLEHDIRARAESVEGLSVRFEGHEHAVLTDRNDPVVVALTDAIRQEGHRPRPKVKTGTADWNVVAPLWNCPIAAYGPGDSALDHTPDERLDLGEYAIAIRVLTRAIETLATPAASHG